MSTVEPVVILRPGASHAVDLLGKWVVCRIDWGDEGTHDTERAQVVGIVLPAPGMAVRACLLMHSWNESLANDGFQYELYLDSVQFLRVVQPPETRIDNIGVMYV